MRKINLHASKFLIICMLLFTGIVASAQVTRGKIAGEEKKGYWSSFMLTINSSISFRTFASSLLQAGNDPVAVIVDLYPPQCTAIFSFQFIFPAPLTANIAHRDILINLRVDSKTLYTMRGSFSGVIGDSAGFVSLNRSNEFSSLITDMKAGGVLRAQLSWFDGSGTIATPMVPLTGFTYSINRAQQACLSFEQPKPAPNPFQSLPTPKTPTSPPIVPSGPQRPA